MSYLNLLLIKEHPWVTANGEDPLLSTEENTSDMITHVTEKDLSEAINAIRGVMNVVLIFACQYFNVRFVRSINSRLYDKVV
jgi:hypothetical protein